MKELLLEKDYTLLKCLNLVLNNQEDEIIVKISEDSILLNQKNNLRVLFKQLKSSGKVFKIETDSLKGKEFLKSILNEDSGDGFLDEFKETEETPVSSVSSQKSPSNFSSFKIPSFDFNNLKAFFSSKKIFLPLIILFLITGIIYGGYLLLKSQNKVNLVLTVGSERFVKSFEIKLSSISNTDIDNKIMRVSKINQTSKVEKEAPTTGKAETGKKAEGEVRFSNSTDQDILLDKETEITYKDGNKDLVYLIKEKVNIPKRTLTSTSPETYVSGEASVASRASLFGSSYNISAGKNLSVKGYSSDKLKAIVSSSFDGGLKNSVNAVSAEDMKKLSESLIIDFKSNTQNLDQPGKVFLRNSQIYTLRSEKFSPGLTEPADILKLAQEINLSYLLYSESEALSFAKAIVKDLVPEGYELYGENLQVEIGILNLISVAGSPNDEANAQLTIRSYKIPVIDQDEIKENLKNKSVLQAKDYLEKMGLVYNIESNSLLNVFGFPESKDKINVSIKNE